MNRDCGSRSCLHGVHFKSQGLEGAFSLSLGKKALDMATQANRVLNEGFDYVATQRDRITGKVTMEGRALPVKDRNVIIFDDIISSGRTMALAVKATKDQGARRVYAACVHPSWPKARKRRFWKVEPTE